MTFAETFLPACLILESLANIRFSFLSLHPARRGQEQSFNSDPQSNRPHDLTTSQHHHVLSPSAFHDLAVTPAK